MLGFIIKSPSDQRRIKQFAECMPLLGRVHVLHYTMREQTSPVAHKMYSIRRKKKKKRKEKEKETCLSVHVCGLKNVNTYIECTRRGMIRGASVSRDDQGVG